MAKDKIPMTPGVRELKSKKIDFKAYSYEYEEKGGTAQTAGELNVDEHKVIKTLVFETGNGDILILLMHGDMEASTKELGRALSQKKVNPCDAKTASAATGYQFGGTSPFGLRKKLNIYAEETILELDKIYINGGKRGFIVEINPRDLKNAVDIIEIKVGIEH